MPSLVVEESKHLWRVADKCTEMNRVFLCMTDTMACHTALNLSLRASSLAGNVWRITVLHLSKHITHQKHFTARFLWSNVHLHRKRERTCSASSGGPLCAFLSFSTAGIYAANPLPFLKDPSSASWVMSRHPNVLLFWLFLTACPGCVISMSSSSLLRIQAPTCQRITCVLAADWPFDSFCNSHYCKKS